MHKKIILIATGVIGFAFLSYSRQQENSAKDTIIIAADSIPGNSIASDSIPADSIPEDDRQEDAFQNSIDTFTRINTFDVDTFGWDNIMINAGRFDSKNWNDTTRIVLIDSARKEFFVMPMKNYISCNFGYRRFLFHYGMDIKLNKGDSVRAAFDGVIRVTKYDKNGFGKAIVIRHKKGLETIYGHLSKILVEPNQKVKAGDVIGLGGNTGRSTGTHLHFEMRYYGEPFDPNVIIDFNNCKLVHDTLVLTKANFEYLIDLRKAKYHTIRSGDTLGGIALRYGSTVTKLCQLNRIKRTTVLRLGWKLRYQ